jgi:hypothetical protein
MNKGIAGGEHKIIFKTPDGTIYRNCEITVESDEQYHHTCVVNLIEDNKIKPKVKKIDIENQDKLKLTNDIQPKFKVGDVVTNISGLYPNVRCTITTVDKEKQCYYFRELAGVTYFKDQDKLTLVNNEEVRPPVEVDDKLDILAKAHAANVKYNVLKYDIEHYPLIYNVLKQIIAISKEGAISYNLVVPMKQEADEAGVYYEEDEVCGIIRWHFDKLGYKIDEKVKDNYNEFFITW